MVNNQKPHADRVFLNGNILSLISGQSPYQSMAIKNGKILALGQESDIMSLISPATQITQLNGKTILPGLIDGHAHMEREGLKQLLPNFHGCQSIAQLIDRLQALAAKTPAEHWIITMPLGEYPEYAWSETMYAEGRLPDRHDLDAASSNHPILIRCAWGYWPRQTPMVSIANSAALALAGISRSTPSPSPRLRIEYDARGEPTGRFFEESLQPLAEFTLFRQAPHFTQADRQLSLQASMQAYNAVGTTGIFEGHGVANETIRAYEYAHLHKKLTIRSRLIFSPGWTDASEQDIQDWVHKEAKRLGGKGTGDEWLRLAGIYTELETSAHDNRLRAACAPRTGWAGFSYDAGLAEDKLMLLLESAAREGLQVCGVQTSMARRFMQIGKRYPIDDLRWVIAHPSLLTQEDISGLAIHGIGITALTGTWIWRRGIDLLKQAGKDQENTICPLKSLLNAKVPTSLASDNLPISLWPSIWQAVDRIDRKTQQRIAPEQCLSREQALQCASTHGAWLSHDEHKRGTLENGKQADLIILNENPLTVDIKKLATLTPIETIVDGRTVWSSEPTKVNQ